MITEFIEIEQVMAVVAVTGERTVQRDINRVNKWVRWRVDFWTAKRQKKRKNPTNVQYSKTSRKSREMEADGLEKEENETDGYA